MLPTAQPRPPPNASWDLHSELLASGGKMKRNALMPYQASLWSKLIEGIYFLPPALGRELFQPINTAKGSWPSRLTDSGFLEEGPFASARLPRDGFLRKSLSGRMHRTTWAMPQFPSSDTVLILIRAEPTPCFYWWGNASSGRLSISTNPQDEFKYMLEQVPGPEKARILEPHHETLTGPFNTK